MLFVFRCYLLQGQAVKAPVDIHIMQIARKRRHGFQKPVCGKQFFRFIKLGIHVAVLRLVLQ